MDKLSVAKRSTDGICRLALNQPSRLEQREKQRSRIEALRQEQVIAKEWNAALANDMLKQKTNIKALHRAIKQSHDFGGPRYEHQPPTQGEERPSTYETALTGLRKSASASSTLRSDERKLEDLAKSELMDEGTTVTSFNEWFEKYGTPIRISEARETTRTFADKPRKIPHTTEQSRAVHLRLGSGIWNDRWVLRTNSRKPIGLDLVPGLKKLPPWHGSRQAAPP